MPGLGMKLSDMTMYILFSKLRNFILWILLIEQYLLLRSFDGNLLEIIICTIKDGWMNGF